VEKSKLNTIRKQASNLLKLLLEIPSKERTNLSEQLDNLELHLSNLIGKIDEIKINEFDYDSLNIQLDLSNIDWSKYLK